MTFGILKEYPEFIIGKGIKKCIKTQEQCWPAFGPRLGPAGPARQHKPAWLAWQRGRDAACSRADHHTWGTRDGTTTGIEQSDEVLCDAVGEHRRGERFPSGKVLWPGTHRGRRAATRWWTVAARWFSTAATKLRWLATSAARS
jgi:hypothetical protein